MVVMLVLSFADDIAYNAALGAIAALNIQIRRREDLFRTIAITVDEQLVPTIQALAGLTNLVRDVPVRPACCETDGMPQILGIEAPVGFHIEAQAAPQFTWEDFTVLEPAAIDYMRVPPGLTGAGVRVAVLDTGVNSSHEALRDQVERRVVISKGNPEDNVGHGTHVAGTIAGNEVDSPRGPWHGVARGCKIINLNVLDNEGNGVISDVIAGLGSAVRCRVDLVNMSLGAPVDFLVDPVAKAVEEVTRRGILVVAAAGNFGPSPFSIGTPGSVGRAVTVGAASIPIPTYIDGGLTAEFSSRGPVLRAGIKPDIAAPGGAGGRRQRPELIYGPSVGFLDNLIDQTLDEWAPLRGSSMATPHMTGLLALLMERYRFTREQLEQALQDTARRRAGAFFKDLEQGWGFVDGVALASWFEQRRLFR